MFLNKVVNPLIIDLSESKINALSQDAINTAIFEVINDTNVYDNLINISRNEEGNIDLISANSPMVNRITREIMEKAKIRLEIIGNNGVNVPLGTFTGLPIFVGIGPEVNIKLIPIGLINCTFNSQFVSAGINQTNHKIFLEISSSVSMILPTASKNFNVSTTFLIAENIIVGEVPQTYLQSDSIDEMLNLVPD